MGESLKDKIPKSFPVFSAKKIHQDCKNHWEADSQFSYPTKGVTGIRMGNFIMSEGKLTTPGALSIGQQDRKSVV